MWIIMEADIVKMNGPCTYQNLYDWAAKNIIIKNMTILFDNGKLQLYLETNASGVSLGESLLQVRDGMQFPRN